MKLQFDAKQPCQVDEVSAVVDLFDSQPLNLVQSGNGGQLLDFTSQYAESWGAAKVMDGVTGGVGSSWCSAGNPGPQSFVFAFAGGQKATLIQLEIYNYGEGGGNYYSKDFTFYYSMDGNNWPTALRLSIQLGDQVPAGIDKTQVALDHSILRHSNNLEFAQLPIYRIIPAGYHQLHIPGLHRRVQRKNLLSLVCR